MRNAQASLYAGKLVPQQNPPAGRGRGRGRGMVREMTRARDRTRDRVQDRKAGRVGSCASHSQLSNGIQGDGYSQR